MNPYLEPHGFLGTGASLLADVTFLAYLLLIVPAMIAGLIFARRKMHRPHHKWTMTAITIVNWILIIFLMLTAYRFDVAPNIGAQPDNTRYLLPVIHALFGIPAQLLATFLVYRMFREDIQVARAKKRGETSLSKYWFKYAKPVMRLTLTLWLITAALGIVSYLTRYDVIPAFAVGKGVAAPVTTPEVLAPIETPEVTAAVTTLEILPPVATPEVTSAASTEEVTAERTLNAPVTTPEVIAPVTTPEVTSATDTLAPRPSPTRHPTPTRTPQRPTETGEAPVETPELDS